MPAEIISILAVIWFRNRGLSPCASWCCCPSCSAFTRHVQKNMLAAQLDNRKAVSRASGFVPETLHNIRTIHTLGKEKYVEQRYDTLHRRQLPGHGADELLRCRLLPHHPGAERNRGGAWSCCCRLPAIQQVLTLFGMSAGTAVAVMNYISQVFTPVESLGMEIQTIQSAIAGVRRINEFLSQPELEEQHTSHALAQKAANPFVELKDVTFGYDDHTVLCHLNLQVQTGEQVTLSGRTGAGKSTIFKLLMGLYSPDSGSVTIGGIPADQIPEVEKRKLFGYVEQSFHMVPGTVKDQIALFDDRITMAQVRSAAQLTGLEETILSLPQGYDTPCTQEIFSQGQWQLLSIARAAAAQPELLLLDEITANLDAETEQAVLRALKQVSEHRTVVSISHRVTAETGRIIPIGSAV